MRRTYHVHVNAYISVPIYLNLVFLFSARVEYQWILFFRLVWQPRMEHVASQREERGNSFLGCLFVVSWFSAFHFPSLSFSVWFLIFDQKKVRFRWMDGSALLRLLFCSLYSFFSFLLRLVFSAQVRWDEAEWYDSDIYTLMYNIYIYI